MAISQTILNLPPPRDVAEENEQDKEARLHGRLLRAVEDAADEIGRAKVCYALSISEGLLSKKLRGVEEKVCDARILAYCLKHEGTGRLARVLAEYAGHLPYQRPEKIDPEEGLREVVALALAGEMGRDAAQKVLDIYGRCATKKKEQR